jgi:glycerol-3-phosphate dehydrogenase
MSQTYDVAVLGGGILGTAIARRLSRYEVSVIVLEKAYDIGEGAAKANSGVLSAGFHPRGGSLKGISCVQGNASYGQICAELGVEMKYIGALYLAFHDKGREMIREKYERGIKNGAPDMRIISGGEARAMEPGLSPRVMEALYAPGAGIINVFQLVLRTAQSAWKNGVEFSFGREAKHMTFEGGCYVIETARGDVKARYVVNAAGEAAARAESWVRPADLIIKPRRGQFYVFDKQGADGIRHILYQAQENDEKGALLAPTVDGNILAGPTSENVSGYHRVDTTASGLLRVEQTAKKILPDLDMGRVIASFAGVRANIRNVAKEEKDFVIRKSAPQMVSALGVKNPGMTSAPYLARMAVDLLQEEGLRLEEKSGYNPFLEPFRKFVDCSEAEMEKRCKEEPGSARIVCRCEQVTEGDILRTLRDPISPGSLNGLKKRLRIGMGRCQGGFCVSRVIELLSKTWRVPPQAIVKSGPGSCLVKGKVK